MPQRSVPGEIRADARRQITDEIVAAARRQLAEQGAPGLSLRAVARDLGMVSSAVYRYVASRDALLTLLIIQSYDALGAAVEQAEAPVPRGDLAGRWTTTCRAVRGWALGHPHEYALIFGSPVPGYAAPAETIGPASRVPALLIALLEDVARLPAGGSALPAAAAATPTGLVSAELARAIAPVRPAMPASISDDLLVHGLMAWTYLLGAVSAELFGHRQNVIADPQPDREVFFTEEVRRIGMMLGVAAG